MTALVVLDPGHGGTVAAGSSTPRGVRGPGGTLEKDLALSVARRTATILDGMDLSALLTREGDENPTLRERTFVARDADAGTFVSLHFNAQPPGGPGSEVWVHPRANAASLVLGEILLERLQEVTGASAPGLLEGPMGVLDPAFHAPGTAACLVEVADLADARQEARLRDSSHLDEIARALARALREAWVLAGDGGTVSVRAVTEEFDIWHEVPLVPQLTGMSCWAAAAAMLVGWRDCIDVDPEDVARAVGRWEAYREGLSPDDVQALADRWGLTIEPPRRYTAESLRRLLEEYGPLWVGEASPGLHVVVVAGMAGYGTPDGTRLRIADPWPIGRGERYSIGFDEMLRNLDLAAGISGVPAQVLHAGGRGASRSVFHERREVRVIASG